ncbi:MAG: hypothetical protein LBF38_02295 [Deltaproteobacteria bacterium]|jgi:hypothetical protein|nr:hypothetical protein [Deltaproteobacteria bacterium]
MTGVLGPHKESLALAIELISLPKLKILSMVIFALFYPASRKTRGQI